MFIKGRTKIPRTNETRENFAQINFTEEIEMSFESC